MQFEVHGVGAVADGGDTGGPVEDVVEEDRGLVADGRLGDNVPGAGYVPSLQVRNTGEAGESPPGAMRISSKNSR
jgi:hypothetical protein